MLIKYKNTYPIVDKNSFVAQNATVIGDVKIGKFSSVWFNSVIRGDVNKIIIGEYTNIQDSSILHVSRIKDENKKGQLIIKDNVTIGHGAILHACKIDSYSLVGMGAVVLDEVKLNKYSIIAAGSVVKERTVIPEFSLFAGNPASLKKIFTNKEEIIKMLKDSAIHYSKLMQDYKGII